MTRPDRVLLGQISRAHGIRGEVLVRSYCEPPENIANYGPLFDESGKRRFELSVRGATEKGLIARIAGIADRNAAELLHGVGLFVDRALLPEPDEDEVYHADLIGLRVRHGDGREVGVVVAVQNFGAGDLIEVKLPGSPRTEFLPFEEPFVQSVDFDTGEIVVVIDEPEGEAEDGQPKP